MEIDAHTPSEIEMEDLFQDLVKTHLMFAVREEVDLLRGKIVDLENTVSSFFIYDRKVSGFLQIMLSR